MVTSSSDSLTNDHKSVERLARSNHADDQFSSIQSIVG